VVKSGESLGLIAKKYNCSVSSLMSWNNLKGHNIHPGQKLYVLSPGKPVQSTPKTPEQKPKEIALTTKDTTHHLVSEGETLASISRQNGCSVDDLKKWNNLKDDTIRPQQKLLVTAPKEEIASTAKEQENQPMKNYNNEDYIYHVVRKGDTLWDIARRYDGVSVEQIRKLNNLSNTSSLKPGQKLKVAQKG
jgi:membrane-bound lytic murein transglycosylase D